MADESVEGYEQIEDIIPFAHGVNIKAEKAGGPINCIRTALKARSCHLDIMLGSMVSTHLGCTQTFGLFPLTKWLDVDGSLLV